MTRDTGVRWRRTPGTFRFHEPLAYSLTFSVQLSRSGEISVHVRVSKLTVLKDDYDVLR